MEFSQEMRGKDGRREEHKTELLSLLENDE